MGYGNCCIRCGREQEDHDTNLVIEPDAYLSDLRAEEIESGFKMSLLTCSATRRPPEYTKLLQENNWNVGFGAGYVSPDPEAEDTKRRENLPSWEHLEQQETLFLVYGHGIVARFGGH